MALPLSACTHAEANVPPSLEIVRPCLPDEHPAFHHEGSDHKTPRVDDASITQVQTTPVYPHAPLKPASAAANAERSLLDSDCVSQLINKIMLHQKAQLQEHCSTIEDLLTLKFRDHEDAVRAMLDRLPRITKQTLDGGFAAHEDLVRFKSLQSDRIVSPVTDNRPASRSFGIIPSAAVATNSTSSSASCRARSFEYLFDSRPKIRLPSILRSKFDAFYAVMSKERFSCKWLKLVVESWLFNSVVVTLIVVNALFNGLLADLTLKRAIDMYRVEHSSGLVGDGPEDLDPHWASFVEVAFCISFSLELVIRILAFEGAFIVGPEWKWNLMDTVLVIVSIVDLTLSASGLALTHIRTLRIVRITRVLRLLRFSMTLQLMLLSALNSVIPFVSAMFFVSLVIFLFATVMVNGVIGYVNGNAEANQDTAQKLFRFFDSLPMAQLSLFMIISGGVSWVELAEPLLEISIVYVVLLVVFVALMVLTVLNIVTAIFVSDAVETAKCNREIATETDIKRNQAIAKEFVSIFKELDENKSGTLSEEEFICYMERQDYRHFFNAMGLNVSNAHRIFRLLDIDDSGELEIEEFVVGCMGLKGGATAVTMEKLMQENKKVMKRWRQDFNHLESVCKEVSSAPRR